MAVALVHFSTHACTKHDGTSYTEHMLSIYSMVVAQGKPNFISAQVPVPSHLDVEEWKIAHIETDQDTVAFLKDGLPASFEGPIPTPSPGNIGGHHP